MHSPGGSGSSLLLYCLVLAWILSPHPFVLPSLDTEEARPACAQSWWPWLLCLLPFTMQGMALSALEGKAEIASGYFVFFISNYFVTLKN